MDFTVATAWDCDMFADYEMARNGRHIIALSHCKETGAWDGHMVLADRNGDFNKKARRLPASLIAKLAVIADREVAET